MGRAVRTAPDVKTHPFMVRHRMGECRYFRSVRDAEKALKRDLDSYSLVFHRLGDLDAVQRVDDLKDQLRAAVAKFGGVIEGDLEPEYGNSGVYFAELIHRKEF
jgi:hypothetical protein